MNNAKFLDWVKAVDNIFYYMEIPTNKLVKMIAYKLRMGDSTWWERIHTTRMRHEEVATNSWERMRRLM